MHLGEGSGAFEVSAISVLEQVYDSDPAVFAAAVVSKVATFDKRDDVRFAGVDCGSLPLVLSGQELNYGWRGLVHSKPWSSG